ncbi:MAG TPA: putative transporter [Verrucomicrobiota bacterium]|nr:putative transporter [Verrucomicrobiota bacterium]HNU49381.1 putative transporter [Verrucomicrobiota bacterium]
MDWLVELLLGQSIAHALLALSMVAAAGVFLGSLQFRGVSLGVAGVLFSGLAFGHCGFQVHPQVLEFVQEFGLILFVYTIGMQVGPGFVASLRRSGLPLNLLAAAVVGLGVLMTLALIHWGGIDIRVAVGLFAGATTNTPALGAAQQALLNLPQTTPEAAQLPGLGYAVAYPFGILGIILTMGILRRGFAIQPAAEAAEFARQLESSHPKLGTLNIEVRNPSLEGLTVDRVRGLAGPGVVFSRIRKGTEIHVVTGETAVRVGDVLLAVGSPSRLHEVQVLLGEPAEVDLRNLPSKVTTRRVVVTRNRVLGKHLGDLGLEAFGVAVTRVSRAEIEFTPTPSFRLQFADTVLLVGAEEDIGKAADALGDSPRQLNHPQIVPIFVGIALGVLIGSWPVHLGQMPAPVKLGLAGGPLLVALILSRVGRIGPLIYYMPLSANFMLRELGITLFLACVGLRAGDQFLPTLTRGPGLTWMAAAALITLLPILLVGVAARRFGKMNFSSLCGVLSGSMTDPPALAFANSMTGSDAPSIAYATVYPLTMLLRVLSAQLLVLFCAR